MKRMFANAFEYITYYGLAFDLAGPLGQTIYIRNPCALAKAIKCLPYIFNYYSAFKQLFNHHFSSHSLVSKTDVTLVLR